MPIEKFPPEIGGYIQNEISNERLSFPSNPGFERGFYQTIESSPFKDRIIHSMQQSPVYGVLYKDGNWSTDYVTLLMNTENRCLQEQICGHGMPHRVRGLENFFIAAEILNQGIFRNGKTILSPGEFSNTYSDGDLAAVFLFHDLEYGLEDFNWDEKYTDAHLVRKKTTMGDFLTSYVSALSVRVDLTDKKAQTSLRRLQAVLPEYRRAVDIGSKQAVKELDQIGKLERITPSEIFHLAFKFADVAEYYIEQRLQNLAIPQDNRNLFFFLCHMVKAYRLYYRDSSFVYSASLKKNYTIPTQKGLSIMNAEDWLSITEEEYNVQVLYKFAEVIGKQFVRETTYD